MAASARAVAATSLSSQVPDEREVARRELGRRRVGVRAAQRRRVEALGARQAEVGLGRRHARRVDRALRLGHRARVGMAGLPQQRPDVHLGAVVVALAEVRAADLAARVDEVVGRPVLVAPGAPRRELVVLRHGIADPLAPDRARDVACVALEGELGRVHADDDEAVAPVARVPGLEVGQRAQAVDAGVGPEVDEHDLAAQRSQAERLAAGRVEPALVAGEVRGGAQARQARAFDALAPRRRDREARRAAQVVEPAGHGMGGLEAVRRVDERGGQVVGDGRLEAHVEVRRHGHAGEHEDGGQRALESRAARRGAHAPREGAPAERQRQQHDGRAQREGEADGQRARRRGSDGDDRGQDRPRARGVDEAQRGADEQARGEAVAAAARAQARQARQRRLQARGEGWHRHDDAEADEHDDGQRPREPGPQPDAVDDAGQADDRHREGGGQAEGDAHRAPAPADQPGTEQGGQDRKDARAEGRARSGDQREEHEEHHRCGVSSSSPNVAAVGRKLTWARRRRSPRPRPCSGT